VLDFNGDIQASETELLRHEITAVLTMASTQDEIVLRLESPGGMVHSYGFAASQLARIRNKNIPLTICVDHVAASGGYMMATIANKIVAAPFAIVGSIGVVATLPNFSKVLKKYDIDYEQFTAGEYKRTVTMFGENTQKAKDKFQADLEDTHVLFKQHISQYRPELKVEEVATGEIWYGTQALGKGLIDAVGTSDDYLVEACKDADVYSVRYEFKKTLQERLGLAAQKGVEKAVLRMMSAVQRHSQTKG
jgi:serine protease SohB